MSDPFTFESALGDGAVVVGFRGTEAISAPYRFDVYLALDAAATSDSDLGDAVGTRATLTLDRQDDRPPYVVHGVLAEIDVLHALGGRVLVGVTLVPALATLANTLHSRMFTDQSIPDILSQVLDDAGFGSDDVVLRLLGRYAPEEHVCQYRESDLDFLSRWMEREGLYYFFEQGDSHETLVITDDVSFCNPLLERPVRFHALAGDDVTAGESLRSWTCRHTQLPARVRVDDYDYGKPTLDVSSQVRVGKIGVGELRYHGERAFSPESTKRLATLRSQALVAKQRVFRGTGNASHLRSGYTFELEDHPLGSFDQEYLVTELFHQGMSRASTPELRRMTGLDGTEVYQVELTAIPKSVPFRTERKTPWPRVYGVEHGVIDGEKESDYAQIDDHGRYKVRFAFDESDLDDAKASTWVRMMQPHGGDVEGWHFPLRKGTEVLLVFLGGDPDRPVIAGVVPNALNPSPVTRANHSMNVIRTGGKSLMQVQDLDGSKHMRMYTPQDESVLHLGNTPEVVGVPLASGTEGVIDAGAVLKTDGSGVLVFGKNLWMSVGGSYTEFVKGSVDRTNVGHVTESLQSGRETTITGDETTKVTGHQKLDVGAGQEEKIDGGAKFTITGGENRKISGLYHLQPDDMKLQTDKLTMWAGPVEQIFGATNATYKSLNWLIPGGADIVTPKWHVTNPSQSWEGAVASFTLAKKVDMVGLATSVMGMSMQAMGLKVRLVSFKAENEASKVGDVGSALKNIGTELKNSGVLSTLAGLFSVA